MGNNIKFTKMNGLGNDFVILDEVEYNKVKDDIINFVKKICTPHFSVGADGLIAVDTNVDKNIADIGWHFYNNDGTMAQMCGNGMRCFAKYIVDNKILGDKKSFRVLTKAGVIVPKVLDNGKVEVNMGTPILEPDKIPFLADSNLNVEVEIWAKKFILNAVSMGNPHCVVFLPQDSNDDPKTLATDYGPDIEKHELFPQKTNVEFIKVISPNEITLDVWERGCGITLACGTGACASVVAGILLGKLDNNVLVHLPGGDLNINWAGSKENTNFPVIMTGDASYSFKGLLF